MTIEHNLKAREYGVNIEGGGTCAEDRRWCYTGTPGEDQTFRAGEAKGDCNVGRRENACVKGRFSKCFLASLTREWKAREDQIQEWRYSLHSRKAVWLLHSVWRVRQSEEILAMTNDVSIPAQCLSQPLLALNSCIRASLSCPFQVAQTSPDVRCLYPSMLLLWVGKCPAFISCISHNLFSAPSPPSSASYSILLFCSVGLILAPGPDNHPSIKPTKLNTALLPVYQTPSV